MVPRIVLLSPLVTGVENGSAVGPAPLQKTEAGNRTRVRLNLLAAALAAALAASFPAAGGERDARGDEVNVILLTDCHIQAGMDRDEEVFGRLVAAIVARRPDLVLVAGDVGEGRAAHYEKYQRLIAAPLEASGIRVGEVLGNHDDTQVWHGVMGERGGDAVLTVGDVAFVLVSQSTKPGGHGDLTEAEQKWIEDQLDANADKACFVVVHHPFIEEVGYREWRPEGWTRPYFYIEKGDEMVRRLTAHASFRGVFSGHVHANRVRVAGGVLQMSSAPCSAKTVFAENPEANPFGYWTLRFTPDGVDGVFHEVRNDAVRASQARHPEFYREMLGEGADVRFFYDYATRRLR